MNFINKCLPPHCDKTPNWNSQLLTPGTGQGLYIGIKKSEKWAASRCVVQMGMIYVLP